MRKLAVLILAASFTSPALAQSMPVATFLAKADALKAKGALALFSSDIGKLKAEIQNSARRLGPSRTPLARPAVRPPRACPPRRR